MKQKHSWTGERFGLAVEFDENTPALVALTVNGQTIQLDAEVELNELAEALTAAAEILNV